MSSRFYCFNCIRDKDSSFNISNLQDGYLPENDFHENTDDDPDNSDEHLEASVEYQMRGGYKIVKLRKPRIVRSIRFHKDKDPENYYREQLMLYYPWRNERKDLLGSFLLYHERYKQVEYIVNENKKNYDHHSNVLDAAVDDIQHENNDGNSQPVAPSTQHINDQDLACNTKPSELFGCFDPGSCKEHSQCDIFNDTGILPRSNDEEELQQNRISDSDYRKLVRSLNKKNKENSFIMYCSLSRPNMNL